jgi:hypothetical protein
MYKHFATVTVMLTAAMALFANGENEQAAAAGAGDDRPAVHKPAQQAKPTFRRATTDTGAWGSDDADGFSNPTMGAPSTGSAGLPPPLAGIPGVAQPADGDASDADAAGAPAGAAAPSAADIAAAIAASRLRSDAGGSGGD